MSYAQLDGLQGRVNRPGLYQLALIAPLSDFETIGEVADVNAEDDTRIKITADHTFKVGKGFTRLNTTKDSAQLLAESLGEFDGKNHDVKFNFVYPGVYSEAMIFADKAQYDEHIILVRTLENVYLQVGYKDLGASVSSNFDSGTIGSGRKGWTFEAQAYGRICIYEGAITMMPEA